MSIAAITFMQNLPGRQLSDVDYMIIDFGALGLQASVFRWKKSKELHCLSHAFTRELSGEKVDNILIDHFRSSVQAAWDKEKNESSSSSSRPAADEERFMQSTMQNLLKTVQQMKIQTGNTADIVGAVTLVPFDEDAELKMIRTDFNALLRKEMENLIQNTLSSALLQATQKSSNLNLRYVCWTGRASLLPLFQTIVKDFFNKRGMLFPFPLPYSRIFFVLSPLFSYSHFPSFIY